MNLPVIVLGAGGHAKVLIDALLASSAAVAGITAPGPLPADACVLGVPVMGGDDVISGFPPAEVRLVNGLGSIGLPVRRRQLFENFKDRGYTFATVVHPSAVIAADVVLGEGVQVMAGAVIQPGCRIGCNAIINTRASVDHDCIIGNHVHISPGVTLSGGVSVGEATHIGSGATAIQGISIGTGAIVAAGAVVVKDVQAGAKVRGVPAVEFT